MLKTTKTSNLCTYQAVGSLWALYSQVVQGQILVVAPDNLPEMKDNQLEVEDTHHTAEVVDNEDYFLQAEGNHSLEVVPYWKRFQYDLTRPELTKHVHPIPAGKFCSLQKFHYSFSVQDKKVFR